MAQNPSVEVTFGGTKHKVFATGPGARLVRVEESSGPDYTPAVLVASHASTPVGTQITLSDGTVAVKEGALYSIFRDGVAQGSVAIPFVEA